MRDTLHRTAAASGRSVNSEVLARLVQSLAEGEMPPALNETSGNRTAAPRHLTEAEQQLLELFRRLPAAKQRALLLVLD